MHFIEHVYAIIISSEKTYTKKQSTVHIASHPLELRLVENILLYISDLCKTNVESQYSIIEKLRSSKLH